MRTDLRKSVLALTVLLIGVFSISQAQEGFKYLILKAGPVYQDAWNATMGIDFVARYHNSFELSLNYYRHKTDYENYLLGLFYKPALSRSKNATLKLRLGSNIGTDNSDFILSALGGLEFLQSLSPGVDLLVSGTGGYYNRRNRWRTAGEIGLRFSF